MNNLNKFKSDGKWPTTKRGSPSKGGYFWNEGYPFDSVATEIVAFEFGDGEEQKRESEEEEGQRKRYVGFEATKP